MISHRLELTTILRQNKEDRDFIACLKEIRLGKCGHESLAFINSLSRDLPDKLKEDTVHIYFKRLPGQIFNLNVLFSLPGVPHKFEAIDEGDTSGIQCPADRVLMLKPSCKVMLLWNKSQELRNGSQGRFVGVRGDDVVVDFDGVGQVLVRRETWTKTSRTGDAVGSRTQIPLALMWAITCHKAQGLTLPSAVIHCVKEFVPGLVYVALTRVKSSKHLQIIDFKPNQLLPPVPQCLNVCAQHTEMLEDGFECCREQVLSDADFKIADGFEIPNDDAEGHDILEVVATTDNLVKSYFERGEPDEMAIDLQTVYMIMADEMSNDFYKHPPSTFSIISILETMMISDPQSEFAIEKNKLVQDLINLNQQKEIVGKILWSCACEIILENTLDNLNEVQLSTTQWSNDTRELYMLLTRSTAYMRDMEMFFNVKPINRLQATIGACLMVEVYKEVTKSIEFQSVMSSFCKFFHWNL